MTKAFTIIFLPAAMLNIGLKVAAADLRSVVRDRGWTTRFPDTNVDVAVIAFSALMIPVNMVFTVYEVVQGRRARWNTKASKGAAT